MSGDWPETRQEIAYEEARAVLDAQNATMGDIDDKAMRTVRLNAVLLGLLVTGLQFVPDTFHITALRAAFALLVASTVCGIVTYNESNLYVGPGGEYVEHLAKGEFPDSRWEENVLETMAGMIAQNYDDVQWKSNLLTATQTSLILGIASAVVSVGI